jgi:hypothetical protein
MGETSAFPASSAMQHGFMRFDLWRILQEVVKLRVFMVLHTCWYSGMPSDPSANAEVIKMRRDILRAILIPS